MARKKRNREEQGGDGWLATYADTITLLLTFFILLYSMSTIDNKKIKQLAFAFQTMMKGEKGTTMLEYDLHNGKVPLVGGESPIEERIDEIEAHNQMYFQLRKYLADNNLSEDVEIITTERGVMIQLKDTVLFETSSAMLRSESKAVLRKISDILKNIDNRILVEGHTDNRPINTPKFPSNWELSAERAVNVVRYFTESLGLEPTKFSAVGCGEYQPIALNDTEENMNKNRRVNILILNIDEG